MPSWTKHGEREILLSGMNTLTVWTNPEGRTLFSISESEFGHADNIADAKHQALLRVAKRKPRRSVELDNKNLRMGCEAALTELEPGSRAAGLVRIALGKRDGEEDLT